MQHLTATTRFVVAAGAAVLLMLPATGVASDGAAGSNEGGGASYREVDSADGQISLTVASGAWLGRATRIRGRSAENAGRTIAIERRRSRRTGWVSVASVRVHSDGTFSTAWKPTSAGRHELRAVSTTASSAGSESAGVASATERVIVYGPVTASWYGPGFYGHRTACGQRLTTSTLGVAHKTLPCGARVALRANGRRIVVPVIDRGPYARGVSYDLTGATARRLGVSYTGRIGAAVLTR